MHHHIYEMYYVNKKSKADIFQETGLSRSSFYRILRTFESCNPQIAEEMKKQGKDVTPADYDKLEMGDELEIQDLLNQMKTKVVEVQDNTKHITFKARLELSENELEVISCGGQLRYLKKQLGKN